MNFCSNCGAKVQANAKFCIDCGANLTVTQSTQGSTKETASTVEAKNFQQPVPSSKPPKQKKNLFVIGAAFVLFLIVSTVSYGFFFNKTPKQLYFAAEINSYQSSLEAFNELFGESWELSKHMSENAFKNQLTISGEVAGQNIPEIEMVNQFLKNSSIKILTSQDPKELEGKAAFSFLLNGANVFEAEVFQSDNQTGVSIPLLYNQYFYINNKEFGAFMREIDPYYEGPEKLENFVQYQTEANDIEKQLIKHVLDYVKYFTSTLREENFTITDDVAFRGEKFRKVTLSLSEKEIKTIIQGLITKLEKDTELQNLFIDQIEAQLASSFNTQMSRSEIKSEFRSGLSEMKSELQNVSFPSGYTSELIVNKKDEVVNRNVTFKVAESNYPEDAVNFSYQSTNWDDGNETTKELTVAPNDRSIGSFNFFWNSTEKSSKTTTNAGMTFEEFGDVAFDIALNMDTKEVNNTKETDFDLSLWGYEFGSDVPTINGKIKQNIDQNLSRGYSNQDFDLTVNIGMDNYYYGYQEMMLQLAVESKTEFTDKLDFPKLTPSSATNVADLDEYEWLSIIEEIGYSLENIFYEAGLY